MPAYHNHPAFLLLVVRGFFVPFGVYLVLFLVKIALFSFYGLILSLGDRLSTNDISCDSTPNFGAFWAFLWS